MSAHSEIQDHFRFCPQCGERDPCILGGRELNCPSCGFRFFFNIAAAAGAFVFRDCKLVLCVRGKEPGLGRLDVPGGFIEFEETLEQGLRREILEELGVEVGALIYLTSAPNDYRFAGVPYKTSDVFYRTTVSSDSVLVPQDDVASYQLFDPLRVDPAAFAFESTRQGYLQLVRVLREEGWT
ncbi:MAG: hypothetical protein RLZ25_2149 [Pseudomonadota bacterium]|jgi:ADP-ribose pyrophosphatase YjhB (NUDIX family)